MAIDDKSPRNSAEGIDNTSSENSKNIKKNWEELKKNLGRTPTVLQVHSIIKDLDDNKIDDEKIIAKIDTLITLNDPKVLSFVKNSKAGEDELTMLHVAAKHYRTSPVGKLIDGLQIDPNILTKSLKTPLHILVKTEKIYEKRFGFFEEKLVKCFDLLVEKKADPNAQDAAKKTPLHYAVASENLKAVELLTKLENIDISIRDENGLTALHHATKLGFEKIAAVLIDLTSVENLVEVESLASATKSSLPIHLAVRCKQEKFAIVSQMLEKVKNAQGNYLENLMYYQLDENKHSVLQLAINKEHLKIIEAILRDYYPNLDQPDANGSLPIHLAAFTGSLGVLEVMIKYKAVRCAYNSKKETVLHVAARKNRFKFISALLKYERENERFEGENSVKPGSKADDIPCIRQLDGQGYPPLFSALLLDNMQSVEALAADPNCDYEFQDKNGNSAFHICAEFNNTESLRFMLRNAKFIDNVFILNKNNETPLHVAARNGNIEVVKILLGKFFDGTLDGKDNYVMAKDRNGRTCLHLASIAGFHNIVYYLLKDIKLVYLVELTDNTDNTALHFAAQHGHLSVVDVLVDCEPDLDARNNENATALEISCRRRFFDISKVLINRIKTDVPFTNRDGFHLLHLAAQEGAHEVVHLLLEKGAPIDTLDKNGLNALDIAVENEQNDVVKVLLENPDWKKLINHERKTPRIKRSLIEATVRRFSAAKSKQPEPDIIFTKENPQFTSMSRHKMWAEYKHILDNVHNRETDRYDFSVLDPPFETVKNHPLMLIAESGQETLLTHETTKTLLSLKWRFIPRLLYYAQILVYLAYIILFGLYCTELTDLSFNVVTTNDANIYDSYYSVYFIPILVFVSIDILKILIQVLLSDGLTFFTSLINWIELVAIVFTFLALFFNTLQMRTQFAAVAVLSMFISFVFLIQKLQVIGIYVLAFRRTLINSGKFMPVFLIVYIGFLLSFRVLVNSNVAAFNTTASTSFLTGITIMLGDFQFSQFGVDSSALNYFLYAAFIIVMAIIILNLFVGIAVGEIKQTLEEADIKQISLRIVYVLRIQDATKFMLRVPGLSWFFNMRFVEYNFEEHEMRIVKWAFKMFGKVRDKLVRKNEVNLVDPQRRLEELIVNLCIQTEHDYLALKEAMAYQSFEVAERLNNSKQRLEDILLESTRKTASRFDSSADDSSEALQGVEANLNKSQLVIEQQVSTISSILADRFNRTRMSLTDRIKNSEALETKHYGNIMAKLQSLVELDLSELSNRTKLIQADSNREFTTLKTMLFLMDSKMKEFEKNFENIEEKIRATQNQIVQADIKLDFIEMFCRQESFRDLSALRVQTSRFHSDYDRITVIEESVRAVDSKMVRYVQDSNRLNETLEKLNALTSKTKQLDFEISRVKQMTETIELADSKLTKCIQEARSLDGTAKKLDSINEMMSKFEPELSKIEGMELTLDRFDEKQNALIALLMDAINRTNSGSKKKQEESSDENRLEGDSENDELKLVYKISNV